MTTKVMDRAQSGRIMGRRLIGHDGVDLTGVESRMLRAALNLERRHVVALANAMPVGDQPTTLDRLTVWERSKGRGYPPALVEGLNALYAAVRRLAEEMRISAINERPEADRLVLRRPLGGRRTVELLCLPLHGLVLSEFQVNIIEQDSQDFWQAITDKVIVLALELNQERSGSLINVVLDKEPG